MMEDFVKSFGDRPFIILSVIVLIAVALAFRMLLSILRGAGGAKTHADWAREMNFSSSELTVLRTLWQWQKSGKSPKSSPVSHLTAPELAALMSKTGIDAMPLHLRASNEEKKRAELCFRFENIGMDAVEAEIAAGMIAGRLGPANDL